MPQVAPVDWNITMRAWLEKGFRSPLKIIIITILALIYFRVILWCILLCRVELHSHFPSTVRTQSLTGHADAAIQKCTLHPVVMVGNPRKTGYKNKFYIMFIVKMFYTYSSSQKLWGHIWVFSDTCHHFWWQLPKEMKGFLRTEGSSAYHVPRIWWHVLPNAPSPTAFPPPSTPIPTANWDLAGAMGFSGGAVMLLPLLFGCAICSHFMTCFTWQPSQSGL